MAMYAMTVTGEWGGSDGRLLLGQVTCEFGAEGSVAAMETARGGPLGQYARRPVHSSRQAATGAVAARAATEGDSGGGAGGACPLLGSGGTRAARLLLPARLSRDGEETAMRSYAIVGELLLSDGTTYTRLATDEAADMEVALRRAVGIVRQWRGERIADRPDATVRDIIEVQVGEHHAAP